MSKPRGGASPPRRSRASLRSIGRFLRSKSPKRRRSRHEPSTPRRVRVSPALLVVLVRSRSLAFDLAAAALGFEAALLGGGGGSRGAALALDSQGLGQAAAEAFLGQGPVA